MGEGDRGSVRGGEGRRGEGERGWGEGRKAEGERVTQRQEKRGREGEE